MHFLRTLFWVVVAVIAVIFAMNNWKPVEVALWGGFLAETKLPVLLAIAFLSGLLPPLILYRATRWRLRRRLETAERTLADLRGPADPAIDPVIARGDTVVASPVGPIVAPPAMS
ncbi:hypothetical protein ABC347_02350 [Sphingomonas sp. 1P06PA]|uniref:hypothetical protein n=1 Tax=Sphingomonas sp. 1P06PA TaxID=554121 RepID=UPI0039A6EACC